MLEFSVKGCRLTIRFSFFSLLAFCCLFAGASSSAFLLLAVLLHEGAHLFVMCLFRAPPESVDLSALGCHMILRQQMPLSYRQNVLVSLAGPFANLISFAVMLLVSRQGHIFAQASLTLGIFHCLPIEPLDGGLALRALLSSFLETEQAEKITFAVSLLLLFPLSLLGFFILLRTRYNFSLLLMSLYLMLYLVLKRDIGKV